jgi:transcriptional regulator with XRE-family HTH domain
MAPKTTISKSNTVPEKRGPGRPTGTKSVTAKAKLEKPKLVSTGVTRPRVDVESTDAHAMTPESRTELSIKQAPLTERIAAYMAENFLNAREFGDKIGTSSSYVNSIMQGIRPVSASDPEKIKNIAAVLQVPLIQVYIWAGIFGPEDLILSTDINKRLGEAYLKMQSFPEGIGFCPPRSQWNTWDKNIKLRFVMLFEIAFQNRLLEYPEVEMSDANSVRFFLDKKMKKAAKSK